MVISNNILIANPYINKNPYYKPKRQVDFGFNPRELNQIRDKAFDHLSGSHKLRKKTETQLIKNMKGTQRFFYNLGNKTGEIQTTIINAIGTALVAPIFIAFNPISKEDKETREYSAWRQPISAVLAVATQVGINIPLQSYIDKKASRGELGPDFDLSIKPAKSYVKGIAKKRGYYRDKHHFKDLFETFKSIKFIRVVKEKIGDVLGDSKKMRELTAQANEMNKKAAKSGAETLYDNLGQLVKQDAKTMVKQHINNVEANVKGLKVVTGLALSLATLPPTCTALNWIYPRFMEAVFPKLSSAQKLQKNETK